MNYRLPTFASIRCSILLVLALGSGATHALAAKPWQVTLTYSADQKFSPSAGTVTSLASSLPFSQFAVDGVPLGAGFSGTTNTAGNGPFILLRATTNSLSGNQFPIDSMFQTGFLNTTDLTSSVDIQIDWIDPAPAPAIANIDFLGSALATRNKIFNAQNTVAMLNFKVTDLIQEIVSPIISLQTLPLLSLNENQSSQVSGSTPMTIVNGHAHFVVNFQTLVRACAPGDQVKPWFVSGDTRLNFKITL